MEQKRNPNKNAELSMEQNGNMIDGIINNLPVPLPEEKPLDKVRSATTERFGQGMLFGMIKSAWSRTGT